MVVVSCNRIALLRRCLAALEGSHARETFHIVLIDNGSRDGSQQIDTDFPNVQVMRLPRNFGLTKALNIGIRAKETDFVLFMHEDTELLDPGAIEAMLAALDNSPNAGAVAPLLVDDQGRPAPQIGNLPPDGVFEPAEPGSEPIQVDYASGAALMVRSFFLKAMRKFDERYGQFGSDAEICFQIRRVDKQVLILPGVRALHHGREGDSDLRQADFQLGAATWIWKHQGMFAWLGARFSATLKALFSFRLRQFGYLISGQKLDGTQS